MDQLNSHWTDRSTDDFLYRIAADFVSRIEQLLGTETKKSLAQKLGVSTGRISQVLNNPGNLTLNTMIKYARVLGLKIAVVTYDDNDPKNLNGPVSGEIFEQCWMRTGKPTDFFALAASLPANASQFVYVVRPYKQIAAIGVSTLNDGEVTATADTGTASGNLTWREGLYGRSNTNSI